MGLTQEDEICQCNMRDEEMSSRGDGSVFVPTDFVDCSTVPSKMGNDNLYVRYISFVSAPTRMYPFIGRGYEKRALRIRCTKPAYRM